MMLFWSLAALLLLAGIGFFLPVLRGRAATGQRSRSEWNLMIHRQRRAELAAEVQDADQAALVAAEMDRDMLTDVDLAAKPAHAAAALPQSAHFHIGLPPPVGPPPLTHRSTRPPHPLHRWSVSAQVIPLLIAFLSFVNQRPNRALKRTQSAA